MATQPLLEITGEERTQPQAVEVTNPTPMRLIELAVQQNADITKLEKLLDLQLRWEANEARKAFVSAMAAFKQNPPAILKNKTADIRSEKGAYKYDYASLDQVSSAVAEGLSRHGISHRWETAQGDGKIKVTCILTHEMGHSERATLEGPIDSSGGKNAIQAISSSVTYLERYTLLAVSGCAAKNTDNDGAFVPNGKVAEQAELIGKSRSVEELQRIYTAAYKEASAAKDKNAMVIYIEAKNKRKAELS